MARYSSRTLYVRTINVQSCVHFQVLLTNRYGDTILPSTLQPDEFETIFNSVSKYAKTQRANIVEQIAALEPPPSASKEQTEQSTTQTENTQNSESVKTGSDQNNKNGSANVKAAAPRKETESKKENQQIRALKEKLNQLPEPELLQTWYRLDENSVPAVYRLQSIR